eukprot:gnl/MRDRNA2_/MRDRNA2_49774_c0_seq1.p1 gnl/MRDRNA2_/MRDRNA2_49774_c0~~gnl/MRDRNA2_/MRDRNA2_49774_c0_seq1.p1  ORF type:complete len:425 (+),score=79.35 gnl/MRDRNA2_/MRDRNA2_49774_c0_seq1:144-1277(+)
MYGLGALSRIYRRFIEQEASLEQESCGLASRLSANASAFMELKDTKAGITKDRLERRFQRIFSKEHFLNSAEIQRFTNYLFEVMTNFGDQDQTVIDIEQFIRACAAGEMMAVDSMIEIFDAHRKKSFLETRFMDKSVRKLMENDDFLRNVSEGSLRKQRKMTAQEQRKTKSFQCAPQKSDSSELLTPQIPGKHAHFGAADSVNSLDTEGVLEQDTLETLVGTQETILQHLSVVDKDLLQLRASIATDTSQRLAVLEEEYFKLKNSNTADIRLPASSSKTLYMGTSPSANSQSDSNHCKLNDSNATDNNMSASSGKVSQTGELPASLQPGKHRCGIPFQAQVCPDTHEIRIEYVEKPCVEGLAVVKHPETNVYGNRTS